MKKIVKTSLFVLATIALLGLSSAAAAEELWVVKDGVMDKEALAPGATDNNYCSGKTVGGFHVTGPDTLSRLRTAKSALGDCELKVVFSCAAGRPKWAYPNIQINDRGTLCFWKTGSPIILSTKKVALPLEGFQAPTEKNPFDGKLHSMAVKRVGDKISFYYDDKKLNEQPIDSDVNLHLWFDSLFCTAKIKSIKLTAEKFSDNLKPAFKSAAPIEKILVGEGSNTFKKPVSGRAASYRIPALAVSKKGTILAFAEARRLSKNDIGDNDAVVKRSEDNGKTWGPEIVIWDDEGRTVSNPSAVVDPKTGRIWVFMGRWDGNAPTQHISYSDDDGKTWSKSKEMTKILRDQIKDGRSLVIPGPGSGFAMQRGKHAGRLIIPMNHSAGGWAPSVVYSDDSGKTWKPGGALFANIGESKCAELTDGSVLFVGNPGSGTRRVLTIITEGGTKNATKLWHAEDLKHAGCQGAVERHSWPKDGKPGILLYSGPGIEKARAQGTLRASYDDGKTWPWKQQYYQGGSGYSDIAVLADGRVAILFEHDGKSDLGFTILPAPPATPPGSAPDKASKKANATSKKWPPMIFDKKIGHYKDLSYEALSDEGLSWEERTRLFGGETATYGPLTDEQRKAKEQELKELLAKIDTKLVDQCEADVRAWLDKVVTAPLKKSNWDKDWRQDWSVYTKASKIPLEAGAAILLRAYEIWGDEKFLKAGLERADIFLKAQYPQGPYRMHGKIFRIQDGWQTGPMRTILYAYKFSKNKKYLESAKKFADVLLPVQRPSGGWPDQWPAAAGSGIVHGMSHNDGATTDSVRMMVLMYHLTGDKRYVANLHKLGPFIKKTNLGEGEVVGWCEQYDDNGRPLRVRQYEFEVPNPKALTRSVGPLLIWLYLMDGDEGHMDLLKRAYAWHETVRKKELETWQLEAWKAMSEGWPVQWEGREIKHVYRPGWPDAYLPDGSNWGRCLHFNIIPWYPVTPEMRKKYGGLIQNEPRSNLKVWAEEARTGKPMSSGLRMGGATHTSAGNSLCQIRRALLEHKRGGYNGLLKYYTNPVKYTPDQHLQARIDAARRALDERNVRLAAMRENGVNRFGGYDTATLFGAKIRWFGAKHTKWGKAYDDGIMREKQPMHTAWYQWQLVYDTMLAQGRIDADTAARGGRGLQGVGSHINLDSWDILGEVFSTIAEKENLFDVPIKGKK